MTIKLQLIVLVAAIVGAFLKRWADDQDHTLSAGTLYYVLATGGVTYLAIDSGMLPDAWQTAALTSPIKAGVVSFVAAGLGGAGLVAGAQAVIDKLFTGKPETPARK